MLAKSKRGHNKGQPSRGRSDPRARGSNDRIPRHIFLIKTDQTRQRLLCQTPDDLAIRNIIPRNRIRNVRRTHWRKKVLIALHELRQQRLVLRQGVKIPSPPVVLDGHVLPLLLLLVEAPAGVGVQGDGDVVVFVLADDDHGPHFGVNEAEFLASGFELVELGEFLAKVLFVEDGFDDGAGQVFLFHVFAGFSRFFQHEVGVSLVDG